MILVMTVLAVLVCAVALHKGVLRSGLSESLKLLVQVGPILIPAFVLAGVASVLVQPDKIAGWLGNEAGLRGVLVGTAAGALTPGGPFVLFPMLAVLLKSGASVGALAAYVSSWALLGLHRVLAFELPILGWRFTCVRVASSVLAPVAVGVLAQWLSSRVG